MKKNFKFAIIIASIFVVLIPVGINFDLQSSTLIEINSVSALEIGTCSGLTTLGTCVANGILSFYEIIIFYFTQLILVIVGYMFDLILFFSLNSDFYRGGLMQTGWEIVRDFTNIIFIFALLTMAFKLVLNQDDGKTKSTLIKTILVSLVINFSLFFTFIVIDSSNLLARVFYNRIEADGAYQTNQQDTTGNQTAQDAQTKITELASDLTDGQPSVSLAIASKINPQKIITQSGTDNFIQAFAILTSAGILNILMIYVFGSLALLFLGRSLGLMISGIIAPLAFASITVPFLSSQKYIGFGNWIKEMIALAFMAPVFMFFMYLIVTFLGNEGALRSLTANNNTGVLATILQTYIFFMIIGGLILLAKKVTTSMAGELGGMAAKGVAGVTTALAAGAAIAATGGAAAAGGALRLGGAGLGAVTSKGSKLNNFSKSLKSTGKTTMAFKADVTKIPGFKSMANASGIGGLSDKIGKVTSKSGLDADLAVRTGIGSAAAGLNDVRAGISDTIAGRDTKAVSEYSEKLQGSRNELTGRRIENAQRTGIYEGSSINPDTGMAYTAAEIAAIQAAGVDKYGNINPITGAPYTKKENAQRLKDNKNKETELKAELGKQTIGEAKAEKDAAQIEKNRVQADINSEQDTLNKANKEIGELAKSIDNHAQKTQELTQKKDNLEAERVDIELSSGGNPSSEQVVQMEKLRREEQQIQAKITDHTTGSGSIANLTSDKASAEQIRNSQENKIEKLKKEKEEVDETFTTAGKLKKVQKQIDGQLQDARSALLKADEESRFTLQDSNMVLSETERLNRVRTQQANVGDGTINTTPTPGRNSSNNN